ncbi:hypothetical protein J2Z17_001967 [Rhizobium halophytocola]|uniref:Uncharacterized protein n=1 Tax=Rhizobium halophytocola TaxID=735519 RepID=A0ABS4DXW2_9HYPH|nr:hypothetical protein [Rhizobium halophytocola]
MRVVGDCPVVILVFPVHRFPSHSFISEPIGHRRCPAQSQVERFRRQRASP